MTTQNTKRLPRLRASSFQRALQRQRKALARPALRLDSGLPSITVWEWDITSDQVSVSPSGATLLGLEPMEVCFTAREVLPLVHPRDRSKFVNFQLDAASRSASYLATTLRMKAAKGEWRPIQLLARAVQTEPGERTLKVAGSAALVSAPAAPHIAAPATPAPARETSDPSDAMRKLLDACADWSWDLDAQGRIVSLKNHSATTAALKLEEQRGQLFVALPIFKSDLPQAKALAGALNAQKELTNFGIEATLSKTQKLDLRIYAYPRFDAAGNFSGYIGVTREARRDAAGRPAAVRDALHMMANQQLLTERLNKQIERAKSSGHLLALLLIELDRMEAINASLGPNVVNAVVLEAGQRVLRCVRENDTLARIGRGEFLVLLSGLNKPDDATRAATAITRALGDAYVLGGHQISCGSNIGISVFPNDGNDAEVLLQRTRIAMLRAKEKGRNSYDFFSHEFVQRTIEHLAVEKDLQGALQRNEFLLHYQPRTNLTTGQITGVEALLRWRRGGREIVFPNAFLGTAEKLGLIEPLGAWALHDACRQLKEWHGKGLTQLKVAVNVSAQQLRRRGEFVQTFVSALSSAGVKGASVELEINETSLVQDMHEIQDALHELANMGARIALDDFGTRYSSLSYLKNAPIHMLKIDRSFLIDVERSKKDARIVRAVIDMAHAMDMQVVAEGVESDSQLEVLRELGCDEFQGNWFCPALPVNELTNRIMVFAQ